MAKDLIEFFDWAKSERWDEYSKWSDFWEGFRVALLEFATGKRLNILENPGWIDLLERLEYKHDEALAKALVPMYSEEFLNSHHGPSYRVWLEKVFRFTPSLRFLHILGDAWLKYPPLNAEFLSAAVGLQRRWDIRASDLRDT